MPRLSPFHRLWSTFYYFLGAAPDIPSSSSTLTFHCTHNKSSSMNPEEWRKWQDGANMDSHGIPDATQVWIRATPSATSTPQPRTNSSSPSEGSSDEAATRGPHVIPEMVGNKSDISLHTVSQSSSQNGPEMKNPRNECELSQHSRLIGSDNTTQKAYPTVTFIHDVIGNGNSGTLSDGCTCSESPVNVSWPSKPDASV
ncbi:hypothetical protein BKA70DRAFT_859024 [Coprinopsis sp. MPI-PUGE-AT-0042]|nr:hypothetical protein BKA70DRAFT_859024 [Coprinopsis sp. MPI-PUGE-AT-0042]